MKTELRSIPLTTLAVACAGIGVACSGSGTPTNVEGTGGGPVLQVRGTGGSVNGTGTDTGTTGTGSTTGTGTTPGGTATESSTGTNTAANTATNTGTGTGAFTDNNYNCGVPPVYDITAGLITDFTNLACAGAAPHSAQYCFGGGDNGFRGEMSAPYAADTCAQSALTTTPTAEGLLFSGTVSGPTAVRVWFEPCAYVHAYNSIQFEARNRGTDVPIVLSVKTLASTPVSEGGKCAEAVCTDGSQQKVIPPNHNVFTAAFIDNTGDNPHVNYIRNQITGFEFKINVPCGTTQQVDFTINHFIFFNSPYG